MADDWWFKRGRWLWRANEDRTEPILVARELCAYAYQDGQRDAIRRTMALSPHIAEFLHMCVLLGVLDSDEIRKAFVDSITETLRDATRGAAEGARETGYCVESPY